MRGHTAVLRRRQCILCVLLACVVVMDRSGFAPAKKKTRELDDIEKKTLLQRGTMERDAGDVERVRGIGAGPCVSVMWRVLVLSQRLMGWLTCAGCAMVKARLTLALCLHTMMTTCLLLL